jgi:hypothetical protein
MGRPTSIPAMPTPEALASTPGSYAQAPDDTVSGAHRSDRVRTWQLVALSSTLVGLTLRLGIIATRDLWADEAFTWRVTSLQFDRMLGRLETDIHPPLHYLVMWVLQEGAPDGWEPTFLRIANLVWFVGLGALAAWSSRRPGLRLAVVPAFSVVAVAPGFVQIGSELRMYGLLLMLVALLLVAVTSIVERPSRTAIVLAALAATAAAWTHYAGVIAAAAIIAAGLVRGGWKRSIALAPVAVVFAVGVLALIPFALPQLGRGISYKIGLARMAGSILDDLSVLGVALILITMIFALWAAAQRRTPVPRSRPVEISAIALIAVVLFSLGILGWYLVKGQNPVNEGVSMVPVYLFLVGILGLRIVPWRAMIVVVLLTGVVTAGFSAARLWGAPNYPLGKRVSHVDVLDEAIREHPSLAAEGGRGWLIVEVDWSDMNVYFREQAAERLPLATVAVGTPANGVVKDKIDSSRGAYQRILVIRRPGTAVVGAISGYELEIVNRWTAIYLADK